jgi:hypothetical protein
MLRFFLLWAVLLPAWRGFAEMSIVIEPASIRGSNGFFRVGHTASGQWWFIDPDDKPFFYKGVCAVNRAGTQGGRRAVPGPYAEVVDRKYDYATSPDKFVAATMARLRAWNFNAFGSWTTEEFFDRGMPYTEILDFDHFVPQIRSATKGVRLPDVWDPECAAAMDRWAAKICAPRRNSKWLVGYFTDNELSWGQSEREKGVDELEPTLTPEGRPSLLQQCISLDKDQPARRAAWEFALKRHGNSLPELSKAWGLPIQSRETIVNLTKAGTAITSRGYAADDREFLRETARRYFRLTAEAIRRHDPNHLILGCRFGGPPGPVVLDECKPPYVDVISANNYRDNFYERIDIYYRAHKMPVLNGEFSWASNYFVRRDNQGRASVRPDSVEAMKKKGRESLERAFTHPGLVGYTWYRWVHREQDPVTYGLVDQTDTECATNTGLLTEINGRAESIRQSAR